MRQPWFWYVERDPLGERHVKIRTEKAGTVRGRHWVIPFNTDDGRWHVYLEPHYYQKPGTQYCELEITTLDDFVNCEWVFAYRVRPAHWECPETCEYCFPPPRDLDACPTCGKDMYE